MSLAALERRAREARRWLCERCFPLWAEAGLTQGGLFHERLSLDHDALPSESCRVRVQARQTYVFSEAWRMGWKRDQAARLVTIGTGTLTGPALGSHGLAGRRLAADGSGLIQAEADLYDTAFVLFALAEAALGPGPGEPSLEIATRILASLDREARDMVHGGYHETLPAGPHRLQNPHMHLLEACLSLHRAQPDCGHDRRAAEIISLFERYFTAGENGLLGEVFETDWSLPSGDAARIVEPGHQFEWVWLLHAWARLTGQRQVPEAALHLYRYGLSTLDMDGRAIQSAARGGAPVDASRRTWPQTEALKAHLAIFEARADQAAAAAACRSFDILMDEYLTEDGGWIDHFSSDGKVLCTDMPASTGYHVVLAFAELMRVADA